MRIVVLLVLSGAFVAGMLLQGRLVAAPTPEQAKQLQQAEKALKEAGEAFAAGKFKAAADGVKQAQTIVAELKDVKDAAPAIQRMAARLQKAHALLELEGFTLPALDLPSAATKAAAARPTVKSSKTAKNAKAAGKGVSFVKEVLPVLSSKCGRCHINQSRGQFSMSTFDSLERGTPDGKVLFPGKAEGSRIVEVIESGDMPRGGGTVAKAELDTLKKWINEGAKYDGASKTESLARLVPMTQPAEMPQLQAVAATGNETVQFGRDIAPIIVANCFDCHGPGRQDGGQLSMETFSGLLRGGQSGLALAPGKPSESLLVKKLRGTAGARMPRGRAPLSDSDIARFEKWIAEGARFDGPSPTQSLADLAATIRARLSTHEELSQERKVLARDNWRTAVPDEQPVEKETTNFFLIGNVDEPTLAKVAEVAEQQAVNVKKTLRMPADQPIVKGRMSLLVFRQRIDYSEMTVVEKRDIPPAARGHWRYNIVDAYGCIVPPSGAEYSLAALVGQQIAGVAAASIDKVPQWFAEGTARAMAGRIEPRDARVRDWDDAAARAVAADWQPATFLRSQLPPEQNDLIAYAVVKSMLTSVSKYQAVLHSLRQGQTFDQALAKSYGGSAEQLVASWAGKPMSTRPRAGR